MIALSLEIYLLGTLILPAKGLSACIAGLMLCLFAGLWFVFPQIEARGGIASAFKARKPKRKPV